MIWYMRSGVAASQYPPTLAPTRRHDARVAYPVVVLLISFLSIFKLQPYLAYHIKKN